MCAKFDRNLDRTDRHPDRQKDIPQKKKFPISSNRRLRSLSQLHTELHKENS